MTLLLAKNIPTGDKKSLSKDFFTPFTTTSGLTQKSLSKDFSSASTAKGTS